MKALVTDAVGSCHVTDVVEPDHAPPAGWVVVSSRAAGICGTDVHILDGALPRPEGPFVLGHEGAGVVTSVPPEVTDLRPGDRVVLYSPLVCGSCAMCRAGHEEVCLDRDGQLGFDRDGTFADSWAAPAANLVVLPDTVSFELAAILGCAGMTAVHAVDLAGVAPGQVVVVCGVGGVGLMVVQAAVARGAVVYAVADAPDKADRAREAGASDVVVVPDGARADVVAALLDRTAGRGVDHYVDLVGSAASLRDGIDALATRGTVVVLTTSGQLAQFDPRAVLLKQARILGSLAGSRDDLRRAVQLAAEGTLVAQTDRRYPLAAAGEGLARVRAREAVGRSLIVW